MNANLLNYNLTILDIRNFDSSALISKDVNLFPDINLNGTIYFNSEKFDNNLFNINNIQYWTQIDVSNFTF